MLNRLLEIGVPLALGLVKETLLLIISPGSLFVKPSRKSVLIWDSYSFVVSVDTAPVLCSGRIRW
jgi:hypothetical protein